MSLSEKTMGECDQCGKLKMVFMAMDPFIVEVCEEDTEWTHWCQECFDERKDDI